MRKILAIALSICAFCVTGCSSCSKDSVGEQDAAPPPPAMSEECCKGLLRLCVEQIDNTKKTYPSLNETLKLCPGIPAGEVQFPLTEAELATVHGMADAGSCCEQIKTCHDLRDRATRHLGQKMQGLKYCMTD